MQIPSQRSRKEAKNTRSKTFSWEFWNFRQSARKSMEEKSFTKFNCASYLVARRSALTHIEKILEATCCVTNGMKSEQKLALSILSHKWIWRTMYTIIWSAYVTFTKCIHKSHDLHWFIYKVFVSHESSCFLMKFKKLNKMRFRLKRNI